MRKSNLWQQAYEMLSNSDVLNEKKMHESNRFVFGVENDQITSYGSLKPNGFGPEGYGVEFYQMIVHPEYRGQGYGTQTFEKRVEVAKEIADDRDMENFYTSVLKIPDGENYRENPMERIVESHGFTPYNEETWKTDYKADEKDLQRNLTSLV